MSGGYAYTDAKIVGATSATIVPGNRVGLVPYHTFTLWNKYEIVEWFAARRRHHPPDGFVRVVG